MVHRPEAVAFDMLGTLFSLDAARETYERAGLSPGGFEGWIASTLRDGFASAAAGSYAPFKDIARGTLVTTCLVEGVEPEPGTLRDVLSGFESLDPHPDAEPALRAAKDGGLRVLTLSNGGRDASEKLLARSGLSDLVERAVGVDEVWRWKPDPSPYLHAAEVAGVEPERLALVAAHAWDALGAREAGLVSGWVARKEKRFQEAFGRPHVSGDTLVDVVEGLLRIPAPGLSPPA